jgi:hypothetical protein
MYQNRRKIKNNIVSSKGTALIKQDKILFLMFRESTALERQTNGKQKNIEDKKSPDVPARRQGIKSKTPAKMLSVVSSHVIASMKY